MLREVCLWNSRSGPEAILGFRLYGFMGLGFRGLGFKGLGVRGLGFRGLGLGVYRGLGTLNPKP